MAPPVQVSREAMGEFRSHISRYFAAEGVAEGQPMEDTDLDGLDLAGFLLAAFSSAREARPILGRGGVVLDAPEEHPWQLAFALEKELPGASGVASVEACVAAVERVLPFEVIEARAGREAPRPRVSLCRARPVPDALACRDIEIYRVIAEDGWMGEAERRGEVFRELLPPNWETQHFVEIDGEQAVRLGSVILAGPGHEEERAAYEAEAQAFAGLFGEPTRCFALAGNEAPSSGESILQGVAWSDYDEQGNGSWGTMLALVVTDGQYAAFLDILWDISSE